MMTPTIRFYMNHGMEEENIHRQPRKQLAQPADHILEASPATISATTANSNTISTTQLAAQVALLTERMDNLTSQMIKRINQLKDYHYKSRSTSKTNDDPSHRLNKITAFATTTRSLEISPTGTSPFIPIVMSAAGGHAPKATTFIKGLLHSWPQMGE